MNELQIFKNEQFGEIRTVTIDNEPYFVGKDVSEILGYVNPNEAIQDHVDVEDKLNSKMLPSFELDLGQRGGWLINESGLYSLILSSKLPKAKQFKRWVTSDVLPSIRKHGAYMTPETLEAALLNPDTIIKIATALKDEQEKNKVLQAENSALTVDNAIMQPKADYFDELVDRNLLTNLRETAKELNVKERKFIQFLINHKYLYRDKKGKLTPYAQHVQKGLFQLKEQYNEKTNWSGTQTLITPKGRETFRLLYLKAVS
ncbi:BRO family protein [Massilioclostridium coli]|uniref:BRO family protein n=1 Tax=Massilioclostridium coli TaxID=1870991 RepID=UPI00085BF623|nr:BRO family protein [Massilioclostridium coli]